MTSRQRLTNAAAVLMFLVIVFYRFRNAKDIWQILFEIALITAVFASAWLIIKSPKSDQKRGGVKKFLFAFLCPLPFLAAYTLVDVSYALPDGIDKAAMLFFMFLFFFCYNKK